ncbi:hypothetical protein O9929_12895 [Vibrio lentus]|nr:hypothetical protein [Vibrio lentus]
MVFGAVDTIIEEDGSINDATALLTHASHQRDEKAVAIDGVDLMGALGAALSIWCVLPVNEKRYSSFT